MRITINCNPLTESLAGIGNYLLSLVKQFEALRSDLEWRYQYGMERPRSVLRSDAALGSVTKTAKGMKEAVATRAPGLYNLARSFRRDILVRFAKESDVYFEPNVIALNFRAKRVVTTVHDFSCYHHPEWHPEERIANFRQNFLRGIERTDAIITPSSFVAEEAREYLNWDREIVTIYHGIRDVFLEAVAEARGPVESDYSLCVGAVEPRKNLVRLLQAWDNLPQNTVDGQKLLIVGSKGWKNKDVFSLVENMDGRVMFFGGVTDKKLAELYRNARCLIYPSLYEGFGLPPVEAMACGCPVVVSSASSLPEVCGDAAQYIDPCDVDSMTDGIRQVLDSESNRQRLIQAGKQRSKLFSWRKSALAHIEVFEHANSHAVISSAS